MCERTSSERSPRAAKSRAVRTVTSLLEARPRTTLRWSRPLSESLLNFQIPERTHRNCREPAIVQRRWRRRKEKEWRGSRWRSCFWESARRRWTQVTSNKWRSLTFEKKYGYLAWVIRLATSIPKDSFWHFLSFIFLWTLGSVSVIAFLSLVRTV